VFTRKIFHSVTMNGQPPETTDTSHRVKILVVDDTPSILHALDRQLMLAGFEPVTATNGLEARELLEADPEIRLVISDWLMPEMDGLELLHWVRATPTVRNIPFLVLTGKDSLEDLDAILAHGPDGCLSKPWVPAELIARVEELLGRGTGC